jgi:hypothetical protein
MAPPLHPPCVLARNDESLASDPTGLTAESTAAGYAPADANEKEDARKCSP